MGLLIWNKVQVRLMRVDQVSGHDAERIDAILPRVLRDAGAPVTRELSMFGRPINEVPSWDITVAFEFGALGERMRGEREEITHGR